MVAVAAEPDGGGAAAVSVLVREYDGDRDLAAVERLEQACEVGPSSGGKKMCLFTDLLGDPLCRVRHSPAYLMLVAENGEEIVGVVRGSVKTVSCGGKQQVFCKVAYLLGLRVSPAHRRRGIARKLVQRMEEWFRTSGAEYAYVATDADNEASVRLFTSRCGGYAKFRTPSLLVHPVFRHHDLTPSRRTRIIQLSPMEAETLYRARFAGVEFFPTDIDAVLNNNLSLGTFLAVPAAMNWVGIEAFLAMPEGSSSSWAVASVWNSKDAFRLQLRGAPALWRAAALATRAADAAAPWLRVPSVPDLFSSPFGVHFIYGLAGAGHDAPRMARALCRHAHNLARRAGARVVVAEVAGGDPVRAGVPHWPRLGAEDLWCVKRLADGYESASVIGDWTKAPPGNSIFVDPREF
ncbi:hypothetical protein PR202_gb12012 [Eleusine coracana subsp. coracana]|uniref:N-acetyltransferase domain-containing protein n=1 Tax=Eleusine coracana subsp. coracana TaxID=191504 RepID=A0AAV5ELX7_ELECO|nr:hypothetical protein QOZ80_7BG0583980 [Eleusine coracana subsp. coracana]KAK3124256.1 hypothetical protein QOZ80_7BG0583990 [Eleusine coracana subsp. coracana]GJN24279.1 hypothetical protein PR202_gb12012 [Eleusine coracana subsp. coracana]